jgi:hypothetical protein
MLATFFPVTLSFYPSFFIFNNPILDPLPSYHISFKFRSFLKNANEEMNINKNEYQKKKDKEKYYKTKKIFKKVI